MHRLIPILLLLTACPEGENETERHPAFGLTGNADAGADVYASTCVSCHAADGTGGTGTDLTETVPGMSRDELIEVLVDGIPGTSMVSYASILTDQQIADVAAYVLREWGS